jgi:hypothetical protein
VAFTAYFIIILPFIINNTFQEKAENVESKEDKEDTEENQTERADKLIAEQELEEPDTVRNIYSSFNSFIFYSKAQFCLFFPNFS